VIHEERSAALRFIRDYAHAGIDEIVVDNIQAFEEIKNFTTVLVSELKNKVRLYDDPRPLFSRYQIEDQIDDIFARTIELKSGGSIVIDQTEALVAIDVNSGRVKTIDIEQTALTTNLEAAEEVARQLKIRDRGGLIVVDFIDMRSKDNIRKVEQTVRDAFESDKAKVKFSRISEFGLMEISRQRLQSSLMKGSFTPCAACGGSGQIRSVESSSLYLLRRLKETVIRGNYMHVRARMPVAIANYMLNRKRADLTELESQSSTGIEVIAEEHCAPMVAYFEMMTKSGKARSPRRILHTIDLVRSEAEKQDLDEDEDVLREAALERTGWTPPARQNDDLGAGNREIEAEMAAEKAIVDAQKAADESSRRERELRLEAERLKQEAELTRVRAEERRRSMNLWGRIKVFFAGMPPEEADAEPEPVVAVAAPAKLPERRPSSSRSGSDRGDRSNRRDDRGGRDGRSKGGRSGGRGRDESKRNERNDRDRKNNRDGDSKNNRDGDNKEKAAKDAPKVTPNAERSEDAPKKAADGGRSDSGRNDSGRNDSGRNSGGRGGSSANNDERDGNRESQVNEDGSPKKKRRRRRRKSAAERAESAEANGTTEGGETNERKSGDGDANKDGGDRGRRPAEGGRDAKRTGGRRDQGEKRKPSESVIKTPKKETKAVAKAPAALPRAGGVIDLRGGGGVVDLRAKPTERLVAKSSGPTGRSDAAKPAAKKTTAAKLPAPKAKAAENTTTAKTAEKAPKAAKPVEAAPKAAEKAAKPAAKKTTASKAKAASAEAKKAAAKAAGADGAPAKAAKPAKAKADAAANTPKAAPKKRRVTASKTKAAPKADSGEATEAKAETAKKPAAKKPAAKKPAAKKPAAKKPAEAPKAAKAADAAAKPAAKPKAAAATAAGAAGAGTIRERLEALRASQSKE
ncbi:MAG: ribonuclease E, partial [Myxococcota bacterium]